MIEAQSIVVRRGGRLVLDRVSLQANRGVVIGIVGPNGAGKSTLLAALYRALPCDSGAVLVDGADLAGVSRREIARQVAVVAQDNVVGMPLTVRDSVTLGRLPHRSLVAYGDQTDQAIVTQALEAAGVLSLENRLITELSGGERQRVFLARAIAQQAGHLLLDEPTNHLDIRHQFAILDLVRDLRCTTVVVLHDLNLAARICDELVLLDRGRVVSSGPTQDVLDPATISAVYRVVARRVDIDGESHLIFKPASQPSR